MRWLKATRGRRRGAGNCEACGVRDNTIAVQRAQLTALRREGNELQFAVRDAAARYARLADDAVQNLHALFTLHLTEHAAERGIDYRGSDAGPDKVRDYALTFMADCAGLGLNSRVAIGYQSDKTVPAIRLSGKVRDVRLDRDGEPVLLVAMDNRGDTEKLVATGYDLAEVEGSGVLGGLLLVVVPFPTRRASIGDGGWIEAIA